MLRRRALGLISTFIAGRFFEQLVQGIQQVLAPQQIDLVIVQGTPEQVAQTEIARQQVAGWLLASYPQGAELLAQQGRPLVTISCRAPGLSAVLPANAAGVEAALEHLLALGHTQIAFVGDPAIGDIAERQAAWEQGLRRRGLTPGPLVTCSAPLTEQGVQAARHLLAHRTAWTAVLAGNDWAALGLLRELLASGCRVPDDVAVIGFDDIPEAQVAQPPLATVRQDVSALGREAAALLLDLLADAQHTPRERRIPTVFVPRLSAGAARLPASPARLPLAQELVRLLLPAAGAGPAASPDLVWPEVDQLVRLLEDVLAGELPPERQLARVAALFATPLLLNASAETLVDLRRVLAQAAVGADTETAQRVDGLLDLILVEGMRSYRRRQNAARRTLSEVLHSQYRISERLLSGAPQQLEWLAETPLDTGCLALWAAAPADHAPLLSVAGVFARPAEQRLRPGALLSASAFPPLELAPGPAATWLVLPVRTADHDWGLLSVCGPVVSSDPWLEDSTINMLEITSGWLGSALEREALHESLRAAAAYEQLLADQLHELTGPALAQAAPNPI